MPEPRCVWEGIVPCTEIPFHHSHSLEALGGLFLYSGFDFLEQSWSWTFAWFVQAGKEGEIKVGFLQAMPEAPNTSFPTPGELVHQNPTKSSVALKTQRRTSMEMESLHPHLIFLCSPSWVKCLSQNGLSWLDVVPKLSPAGELF